MFIKRGLTALIVLAVCYLFFLFGLNGVLSEYIRAYKFASLYNNMQITDEVPDDSFLELLQYKMFRYFIEQSDRYSGLVKDRAGNFSDYDFESSSIAACGFAIPAYVVGIEHGWISERTGYKKILKMVKFIDANVPKKNGFLPHFINAKNGEIIWDKEYSSIDTAIFAAGLIFGKEYFKGTELDVTAHSILDNIDWQWMLNGGDMLSMGWVERDDFSGFLPQRWDHYNESLLLYLIAVATGNSINSSAWDFVEKKWGIYGDYVLIESPPLFTHQYPHIFFDLRNKHDKYADYFLNSVNATLANREFCIDNAGNFKTYSDGIWGLTACDGPDGYKAYGAKPGHYLIDGTVAPTAPGGSFPFTPELSVRALRKMYELYGDRIWGRYGFSDAFNVDRNWYDNDVIGIDTAAMLLMIENYRNGLVWNYFMESEEAKLALKLFGFEKGAKYPAMPERPVVRVEKRAGKIVIDGDISDWRGLRFIDLSNDKCYEFGNKNTSCEDCSAGISFAWDEKYFYFFADICDDDMYSPNDGDMIYKNDCLEFFFDLGGGGFSWNRDNDLQIGFSPAPNGELKKWAWLREPVIDDVKAVGKSSGNRYFIEGEIPWEVLGIKGEKGVELNFSPSFHDIDNDGSEVKFNMFFQDINGKDGRKKLALFLLT